MTPEAILVELLVRLGATGGTGVLVGGDEVEEWSSIAVAALQSGGLIRKAAPATSTVCPGCEQECAMPVHVLPAPPGAAFVFCDRRDDVDRVRVPMAVLERWLCDPEAVCAFVAACLGLSRAAPSVAPAGMYAVGMARGDRRSQMLCLEISGDVNLVAGDARRPLAQLVQYENAAYTLDAAAVRRLIDSSGTGDSRYTPSSIRREARKLKTQEMHDRWHRAYLKKKKQRPGMSDRWYAQQIAKSEIANNRSSETIRKHMKR